MGSREPDQNEWFTTAALEAVEKLLPLAEARGITLAQLSLAWLMDQPGVTSAILGARIPEYLRSGVEACEVKLTDGERARIDEIVPPGSHVSNFYEPNIYRPLRMAYSSAARAQGAGAFIPDNGTGSDRDAGREDRS